MTKKQVAGIWLIIAPPIVLILTIAAFAIISFVLTQSVDSTSVDSMNGVVNYSPVTIVRMVLGLIGIVAVIGIPVGLIAGIVLLATGGEKEPIVPPAPTELPPTPPEAPVPPTV